MDRIAEERGRYDSMTLDNLVVIVKCLKESREAAAREEMKWWEEYMSMIDSLKDGTWEKEKYADGILLKLMKGFYTDIDEKLVEAYVKSIKAREWKQDIEAALEAVRTHEWI